MQAYLIIVAIIVSILFLIIDVYLMAFYSHKQETNLSVVNLLCKFLIILTLLQTQFQPFFLILDVENSRTSNNDFTTLWLALYFSLLVNLAILKPVATSLYERDHDDPCWKNTLWIIVEIMISTGLFALFVGIGWSFWGSIQMPVDLISIDANSYTISQSSQAFAVSSAHFKFSSSLICFIVAFFCILGYPVLACCGACGMTVLPISLILEFVNRPKFRKTADAKKVSQFLKVQTVRLLKEGDRLRREAKRSQSVQGFFQKRQVNKRFQKQLKAVQDDLELQRDYYQLFKMELQMQTINPLVFWAKLLLGILSAMLSIILWIQILLAQLIFPEQDNYGSIMLDTMFNYLEAQNANFISIAILMIICVFLTGCIIKGSVFFSNSIPLIIIHPIVESKTWLNSFLFHLTLCSISSASLIHMISKTFPYYLRGGCIVLILNEVLNNMNVVGTLLNKNIFTICFLGVGFLGILYVSYKMLYASETKGQLLKRIQSKRLKLFGKQNQNRSLKFIEMTEMNKNTPLLGEDKKKKTKNKKTKK